MGRLRGAVSVLALFGLVVSSGASPVAARAGLGAPEVVEGGSPSPAVRAAVGAVLADAVSATGVALRWAAVAGADGYVVDWIEDRSAAGGRGMVFSELDGSVTATVQAGQGYVPATPPGDAATVAIADDDATTVALAAAAASIAEDGGTTDVTVTLSRTLVAGESVTVPLEVRGATAATHYTLALKTGDGLNTGVTLKTGAPLYSLQTPAIVFGPGARVATLLLTALANTDSEDRTVKITYNTRKNRIPSSSGLGGGITTTGSATVALINDDVLPKLSVSDATATEGGVMSFTISIDKEPVPAGTVLFTCTLVDVTAVFGSDYVGVCGGQILTGQTSITVVLLAVADNAAEGTETFKVVLSSPVGATIEKAEGIGTINDP